MSALHGVAFLQSSKPLLRSVFKAASHQTMSELQLLSSEGPIHGDRRFTQSKSLVKWPDRQCEELDLGRLRKKPLRLKLPGFLSVKGKVTGCGPLPALECRGQAYVWEVVHCGPIGSPQYLVSKLCSSPVQRVSVGLDWVQSQRTGRSKVNIKIIHSETP